MNNRIVIVVSIVLGVSVIVNGYLYFTLVETENDLTSQIDNLELEKNVLNSNITMLTSEIDSLDSKLNRTLSERDTLQNERDSLRDNVTALTIENNNLAIQVNSLTNERDEALEEVNYYSNLTTSLNTTVNELNSTVTTLIAEKIDLETEVSSLNEQIVEANSNITSLENKIEKRESVLNLTTSNLETLVFHLSQKNWTTIPDINSIYSQILALNNGTYDIVLLPELEEHKNWTAEQEWIENNFQNISIMLETFSSTEEDTPIKLSIENLTTALTKFDVEYLRFAEPISWHIEHNMTFPIDYVESVLAFCRENGLKIFWTEWKTDHEETNTRIFTQIKELITGYEDIVTVSFSTNSGEEEPALGFLNVEEMFEHWGASIQAWYWETRYNETLMDMPPALIGLHTAIAKSTGAEILQFEPYWYFFNPETGETTENLELLFTMLNYNPHLEP